MYRVFGLAVIVAWVAGVAFGFVWWGLPLQRLRDDVDALVQRAGAERELRSRLDVIVREGRK
jgi:hypothetical protein